MDVVYIDASSCARKTIGDFGRAGRLYLAFFVLAPYVIVLSLSFGQDALERGSIWAKIAFTSAIAIPVVVSLAAIFRDKQFLRPSGVRVDAYGVTVRRIVGELARFRRRLDRSNGWRRARTLGLVVLLRLAAIGSALFALVHPIRHPQGGPTVSAAVLTAIAIAAVLWVAAGRLLRPKRRNLRVSGRGWMLRAQGVALVLFAGAAFAILYGLIDKLWGGKALPWFVNVPAIVIGGLCCVLALEKGQALWFRARAEMHPASADARRADRRPPILFLRSFADDSYGVQQEMTSAWDEPGSVALEDALHEQAGRYGPFLAVAEPGRAVTSGAARDRFQGDEWRQAVQRWMDEALLITLVAGPTAGVQWELDQAIARGHAGKLLILLAGGPLLDARWRHVCRSFSGSRWHAALIGADVRQALAVHLAPHGRIVVIASRARTAGHYEAAVELAVYGMFCRDGADASPLSGP